MYEASVLEVLVASPSDTTEQRQAIREAIIDWNGTNSRFRGVVLLPVLWETHTYPDLGKPPQVSINAQIVDDADILIATFWTTLGTPTEAGRSGTDEEIEQFVAAGKPVLVYFCEMPAVPIRVDADALERLQAYREEMMTKGLFGSYVSVDELKTKVRDDLTRRIQDMQEDGSLEARIARDAAAEAPVADGPTVEGQLDELRRSFAGYASKWDVYWRGLMEDFSVDARYDFMREVEAVTLEVLRLVASTVPGAPIRDRLADLATRAGELSRLRVYMDGGKSFGELNGGIAAVVQIALGISEEPWTAEQPAAVS